MLKIYEQTESLGYNDLCDMLNNGEKYILDNFLKPNQIVFDVGSNVGDWSQLALEIEPSLQISCFEPNPVNYQSLCNRLQGQAQFYPFALSNHVGLSPFFYKPIERWAGAGLYHIYHQCQTMDVVTMTLDLFCSEHKIEKIDYLKIDTEGSEKDIIFGAANLLSQQHINALQFEYGRSYLYAQATLENIINFLTHCGYAIFRLHTDGMIHISQWYDHLENYKDCNYFAILPRFISEPS